MFCRELCEVVLFEKREKLGGPGKIVEIVESKIGKRKYHRDMFWKGSGYLGELRWTPESAVEAYFPSTVQVCK